MKRKLFFGIALFVLGIVLFVGAGLTMACLRRTYDMTAVEGAIMALAIMMCIFGFVAIMSSIIVMGKSLDDLE